MKVVQLNRWDVKGGAAIAAYRQHKAVQSIGTDSTMFVREKLSDDCSVQELDINNITVEDIAQRDSIRRKAETLLSMNKGEIGSHLGPFSLPFAPFGKQMLNQLPDADILNLHWISGLVDFPEFFSHEKTQIPIVWTLHDMYPFTGGCHYSGACGKFVNECGACEYISSNREVDLSRKIHEIKSNALSCVPFPITVVAPSKWLARQAKRSLMFKDFDVHVIPYSLDQHQFKPRSQKKIREDLNLPSDKIIAFFPSDYVSDPRKGLIYIEQAFRGLTENEARQLLFVTVGNSSAQKNGLVEQLSLPYVSDPIVMSKYYNAADFTLLPSIEDNLPNIILESMSSGTPLIAFNTGGAPDFIVDNKTGWLVEKRNVSKLVDAIRSAISSPEKILEMGNTAQDTAKKEFAMELQGKRYLRLYEKLKEACSLKAII
ncbi:glycosyltransferase [Kiloniella sp.]|uniref:glycosyltransferase n=1 Tax=Kiloniella sp. TaxID=1938587 RepID=UPI003A955837